MQGSAVWVVLLLVAVVVLVAGAALVLAARTRASRRTAALRRRFGSEYDRAVEACGGQREGEAELQARLRRRNELSIRPLDETERERFGQAWESAQASFVDTPVSGLREADLLVMQVMRDRGYPVEHFDERARLISVDHPDLVQHFRTAHAIAVENEEHAAGTEDMRQAMVGYRYLFEELVDGGNPERTRHS